MEGIFLLGPTLSSFISELMNKAVLRTRSVLALSIRVSLLVHPPPDPTQPLNYFYLLLFIFFEEKHATSPKLCRSYFLIGGESWCLPYVAFFLLFCLRA